MDATSPTGPPAAIGSAAVPRGMRAEFRAVLLYALWAGLALGANALGIATLPASAGLILIAGIALTSALFVGLTRIPGDEQPTALTIIAAQLLMGLIWATLYAYFASGTPLVAAGMYTTAVGFGLHAAARILQPRESHELLASNAELQQELERVKRRAERDQITNSWVGAQYSTCWHVRRRVPSAPAIRSACACSTSITSRT
jgi:hypothetical protein